MISCALVTARCLFILLVAVVPAVCAPQQNSTLTQIPDPNGQTGDYFGYSVSTLEGFAVVGSPYTSRSQFNQGLVTTFHNDQVTGVWIQDEELVEPTGPNAFDYFGYGVFLFRPTGTGARRTLVVSAASARYLGFPQAGLVFILQQNPGNISHWDNLTAFGAPDPPYRLTSGYLLRGVATPC